MPYWNDRSGEAASDRVPILARESRLWLPTLLSETNEPAHSGGRSQRRKYPMTLADTAAATSFLIARMIGVDVVLSRAGRQNDHWCCRCPKARLRCPAAR